MARTQSVVSQECSPVLFEVVKLDNKIDLFGPCILSDYELESNFRGVVDISLVESPFLVHRGFGIMTGKCVMPSRVAALHGDLEGKVSSRTSWMRLSYDFRQ